jgi:hypothetical protein
LDDSWCCKRIRSQHQDQQNNRAKVSHGMKTPFALSSGKLSSKRAIFTINSKSRFQGQIVPRTFESFTVFQSLGFVVCTALHMFAGGRRISS